MFQTGPNELRTIIREDLGFYNSVVVGGVYEFDNLEDDFTKVQFFNGPLKYCIDKHAFLAVTIEDMHTERAFYNRATTIDINNHIQIAQKDDIIDKELALDELMKIEQHFMSILKIPWTSAAPPWKIIVVPLSKPGSPGISRCLITFVFSHTLGDGIGGLAFHHTLLDAFRKSKDGGKSMLHTTPEGELAPAFDTPERLPISWSYLIAPLLGALLPTWLGKILNLKASVANNDAGTWTGAPMFVDPSDSTASRVKLLEIPPEDVMRALAVARKNGAKLTAVMHQLIIRALDRAVPDPNVTNWLSHTAVNMRRAVGVSDREMGLFVTGCFQSYSRINEYSCISEEDWTAARSLTQKLAESATVTKDQPIGLLRYVPSIRNWMKGKMGQDREESYDISNLGAFSDSDSRKFSLNGTRRCELSKMLFSHSACPTGAPLIISTVSVKGGSLIVSLGWKPGALGISKTSEDGFVDGVRESLREGFRTLE